MNTALIVFSAIVGGGGISGMIGFAYVRATRAKINAEARMLGVEADDLLSGRAMGMYQTAENGRRIARAEADHCREWRYALEDHKDHAERIMRDHGIEPPVFKPPPPFVAPDLGGGE